jgi:hypothetical protein
MERGDRTDKRMLRCKGSSWGGQHDQDRKGSEEFHGDESILLNYKRSYYETVVKETAPLATLADELAGRAIIDFE